MIQNALLCFLKVAELYIDKKYTIYFFSSKSFQKINQTPSERNNSQTVVLYFGCHFVK